MIPEHTNQRCTISAFQRSKKEDQCNGDSYYVIETEDYFVCILADGLGSGKAAKEASLKAIDVVEQHHHLDVETLMSLCNDALYQTRGAVITLFKIYFEDQKIEFCGIGNVRLSISAPDGSVINPITKSGYLSGRPSEFAVKELPYEKESMFIIYSDGINLTSNDKRTILRSRNPHVAIKYLQQKGLPNIDDLTCVIGKIH